MPKRIAVTGATGRLGRAILQKLVRDTDAGRLVAIARTPGRIEVAGIEQRAGDYQSVAAMAAAFAGVDTVVMISAPVVPGTDRVQLHRNVMAAAREAGVRKLVYTSVIGSEDVADTLFAAFQQINRQTEQDLAASGLDWIVARNGLYLELDLGHILRADEGDGVYRNNGGDGRCGYISIDELAEAIACLAREDRCNGQVLNLVGEALTQAELVALADEVFGLRVRYEAISTAANIARFMADAKIAARGEEVARMLTGCFECIARGAFDVPSHFALAAGRPAKPVRQQMVEHRRQLAA